jgi:putative nucleotidyltransferase with HDIG domain
MSDAPRFLLSLGQCLAANGLYRPGHPARERAVDAAFSTLCRLLEEQARATFSFVGSDTIVDAILLPEMSSWDWGRRLAAVGVARIEVDADVTRDAFDVFVDDIAQRLSGQMPDTAGVRQLVYTPIRYGSLGVDFSQAPEARAQAAEYTAEEMTLSLTDEAETIGFVHGEVEDGKAIPMHEVETVVRTLGLAMRREARTLIPLMQLRQYDEYTTTHASNVAVLSMGLAEELQLTADEVRSFGVAGLLHDIGKVRIPKELLNKPGRFTDEERAVIQRHPFDGAKMLLDGKRGLGIAAIVAYEHHICLDGTGYPTFQHGRQCHCASRAVHICDVYDALCTNRPYRPAWPADQALTYISEHTGTQFDARLTTAFVRMIKRSTVVHATVEAASAAGA